ncbi:MAG TPA: DNA cytosine methyltransferase [Solirubrobacterales bacterium]|nr:DNA cytosine methyltransferase [Solirubrobacterales bacterium]
MAERRILDLFAGAGGWEEGLRGLGHWALGLDSDRWACATARAAGHERLEADVAALDPAGFAPVWGLIASPPCQAYSAAGSGLGRLDKPWVIACARELAAGEDTRAERLASCRDERSLLTVEPLRWALSLRPRWLALEQVPSVLELWEEFAALLGAHGYDTALGLLSAERYGVPQTRRRAFLVASLDGEVALPAPTRRSFSPRRHGVPEEERHLPRWVSMAEALGWREPAVVRTNNQTSYGRRPRGLCRSLERPAHTLDSASGSWTIEPPEPERRPARPPEACERHERRRAERRGEEPPSGAPGWTHRRPATAVLGDPRILGPGHWPRNGAPAAQVRRRPVRVTVEQAAVLQGFRHDYPWQGSRTERFRQVGNAVCPPLGRLVLAEAMRPTLELEGERRG